MNSKNLTPHFVGEEDELPSYVQNSWDYVAPRLLAASKSARTEAEVRAAMARFWGDKTPIKRGYTRCCDCPGHFPTSGNKKRCSPCSDIHAQNTARARCKAARAGIHPTGHTLFPDQQTS